MESPHGKRLDKLMQAELGKTLSPWRIHDLRRTISTLAAGKKLRVSESVIDRQLNHARAGMKKTYQHQDYLEERESALVAWGAYVAQIAGEETQAAGARAD